MSKRTPSTKSKRYGCLAIILTTIFVVASGIYFSTSGLREAKRIEQTLIDRYDWANNYTPAIDGAIPAERVEQFILVRQAVQGQCGDYQAILDSIAKLDDLESGQDAIAQETASTSVDSFKSAFSAGPKMIEFSSARNQALLDAEMGIGEYMYIYLTAYGPQLAAEEDAPHSGMEEAHLSPRARNEFTQILKNQLAALEASPQLSTHAELSDRLGREIEALESGAQASPWPDGPGAAAWESLAPYRQQLDELYCAGLVKLELLQKNRGFQFEG